MTEKEIIQKIYEVIKLVDCMRYNPFVDFNYLRAKGAYNVIKNQVEHIEAENAALRERLDKAITPEFKIYEDVYFIDYVNEKGYSEYTTGKPKIREAFITCVSQSTQTEFLYRLQPKDLPQEILNDSTIHDEWWDWRSFYAKEIFKTREAAEARLKEIKEEKNEQV